MTTQTASRTRLPAFDLKAVMRFFGGVSAGWRAQAVFNELNAKTDRELADMGLTREDLPRVAFFGVDPR